MSVSLVNIAVIAGTLALVLGITVLALRIVRWRRDVALRRHGVPVLVMPLDDAGGAPRPVLTREAADEAPPSTAAHVASAATQPHGIAAIPQAPTPPDEDHPTISTGPFRPGEVRPGSPSAHLVLGSQVRFFRTEEGTLEFLPGRLEVVGGEDIGQEIHFARLMGAAEPTTITFGRAEGAPLRHIQLLDPTVSRQHARMTWDGSSWRLTNLSSTNPVLFNGAALGLNDDTLILSDGDRFEMGAVVFVFHAR